MFLKSIEIKSNIVYDSNRTDNKKFFKVKSRTYTECDRRKPIYSDGGYGRVIGYEKRKVIEKTFIIFEKGLNLEFKSPLTIIVGDNGCGKSSLINRITPPNLDKLTFSEAFNKNIKKETIEKYLDNKEHKLSYIAQPEIIVCGQQIHKSAIIGDTKKFYDKPNQAIKAHELLGLWNLQTFSNGESTLDFLNSLNNVSNSLIVLDEPETSLSIKSQNKVVKLIKKLIKQGNQLIVVTHSSIIMNLSNELYDFEKKEYVDRKEYIEKQLK